MEDEGVEAGPLLGYIDLENGLLVERIGRQTVDGLRGDGHKIASPQEFRRMVDILSDGGQHSL